MQKSTWPSLVALCQCHWEMPFVSSWPLVFQPCRSLSHSSGWPCPPPRSVWIQSLFETAHLLVLICHSSLGIKLPSQFPQAFSKLELNLSFPGACPAQSGFAIVLLHLHLIFMGDTAYEGTWWQPRKLLIYLTQKHFGTVLLSATWTLFLLSCVMGKN